MFDSLQTIHQYYREGNTRTQLKEETTFLRKVRMYQDMQALLFKNIEQYRMSVIL